jgi:hypothetical protein
MVETILVDNTNVSNMAILSILNGIVPFTHVEPAIKQHLDMHQRPVKDVFLIMGSEDIMTLMDTTMVISLENINPTCFLYIFLFFKSFK